MNTQKWCMPFLHLIKIFHKAHIIFLLASRESLYEDNRSFALKVRQLSHKAEGPGSLNHCSEGNCPLKSDQELLLWIFCKREINFYYVWMLMCNFVWLGTTASAILIHTNIIITFVTYLWNIFHSEILNSLGRSREGSDNILTSWYCMQFEYKKH